MMFRSVENAERRTAEFTQTGAVDFDIASDYRVLSEACRLVYRAYLRQGLIPANSYEMRITPYHLLETSEVLVAVVDGEVTSTALLVHDGQLGLPLESTYRDEVEQLRLQGYRLAEVSCFADRRADFRWTFPALVRLMSLIAQCAASRGIDQLLIAVHPRHGKFYRRYLGFKPFGPERAYAAVQGNPAVALALDLNRLAQTHPRGYQTLLGDRFPDEKLQYRKMDEQWVRDMRVVLAPVATDKSRTSAICVANEGAAFGQQEALYHL